jgi:hypothetical protein
MTADRNVQLRRSRNGRTSQPEQPASPEDRAGGGAKGSTSTPPERPRDTVLRYDNLTDPVWPGRDEPRPTQPQGPPARRFGALAGRVMIARDFDAPIDLTPSDDTNPEDAAGTQE